MKRCLILGCSATKVDTTGEIPAIQRYDGPAFRVLRRFLSDGLPEATTGLTVFVLSAEFGLISSGEPIPVYNYKMTPTRAKQLRSKVLAAFEKNIATLGFEEIFLSMGQAYLHALAGYESLVPANTQVIVSRRSTGYKLRELRNWLYQQEDLAGSLSDTTLVNGHWIPDAVRGKARLRGVEIAMDADEVREQARQALRKNTGAWKNFRNWYVLVDDCKVAPKWLVSTLTGVPVSDFDASEARRVLKALGVPIYSTKG